MLAQAEATQEAPLGSLTGSAQGISSQGVTGDEYATAIYTAIRKNWNIPTGMITDTELAGLAAEVRLSILGDGTLAHTQMRKASGNQYFDDSCMQAVKATHQVPPPPAELRARFEHGTLLEFSGKDITHQGAA
jgi:TonB family protein